MASPKLIDDDAGTVRLASAHRPLSLRPSAWLPVAYRCRTRTRQPRRLLLRMCHAACPFLRSCSSTSPRLRHRWRGRRTRWRACSAQRTHSTLRFRSVLSSALLARSISRACRVTALQPATHALPLRLPFALQLSYACEVTGKRLRVKDTDCSTALLREAEQYDEVRRVGSVCSPGALSSEFSTHSGTHCANHAVTEMCLSEYNGWQRFEAVRMRCSWRVLSSR